MTSRPCDICRIFVEHQLLLLIEKFDINIEFCLRSIANGRDKKSFCCLRDCCDDNGVLYGICALNCFESKFFDSFWLLLRCEDYSVAAMTIFSAF